MARLSLAYDLNSVPTDIKPRILSTAHRCGRRDGSLKLALEVASCFEPDPNVARRIASQAGKTVATWRKVAPKIGLTVSEMNRMASAFEHEDLKAAVAPVIPAETIKKRPDWRQDESAVWNPMVDWLTHR